VLRTAYPPLLPDEDAWVVPSVKRTNRSANDPCKHFTRARRNIRLRHAPTNGWLGKPYFLLQFQLPTIVSDVVAWPCLPNLTSAGIVRLTDPLEPSPCTVTVPVVSA
jgi:hypothetical protein